MARYSKRKINKLIIESDNAQTADEKGDKLEELTKYLFSKVLGVKFHKKNVLDGYRAHELDVVFTNDVRISDLYFLGFSIITECKNTAQPIGSNDVRWFIDKLRDRGLQVGVLVSFSGITGAASGVLNAHSEILNAVNRDSLIILVLNRDEIKSLGTTEDLVKILIDKKLALTIERTVI